MPLPPDPKPIQARYDYIVVGAGSAGCIVAARLATRARVLLLEAGDAAESHPETLLADGFKDAFAKHELLWHRMSNPQASCGQRQLYAGSGRVMGGSGAVNGMVYTRGDRHDFSSWPEGWRWEDLQSSFLALEAALKPQTRPATSFSERCIQAAITAGFLRKDGLNDGELNGYLGYNELNYGLGERRHSYKAYIKDAAHAKLDVLCNAAVQRLRIDATKRAHAVEFRHHDEFHCIEGTREIVLCAGALETPKLLMLSGVGPAKHLQSLGIATHLDSPEVGENLQDHPNVCLFYRSKAAVDFKYPQVYGFTRAGNGTPADAPDSCYVFYAAAASIRESMLRMVPILLLPGRLHAIDWLRNFLRGVIKMAFRLPLLQNFVSRLFGIVVILGKPRSRGRLRLRSTDPGASADIELGYYSDDADRLSMLAAIAKARQIAAQPAFQQVGIQPLSVGAKATQQKRIWSWAKKATMTTFHYCGSCRMGSDAASPVDTKLRLKGIAGLRIADASVIPEIPVSALNAPSMLIGYRAAEFILAENASAQATDTPRYGT